MHVHMRVCMHMHLCALTNQLFNQLINQHNTLNQLFQVAGKELSYKQMSEEDVFGGDEDDETNVTNIAWKQKFFSVHTSELDDKEEACHTIMSFVTYLKV